MADFLRLTDYRTGEGRVVNATDIMLAAPHHMGSKLTLRTDVIIECKEPFEDVAKLLAPVRTAPATVAPAPEKAK
jgi:hypothetical protein